MGIAQGREEGGRRGRKPTVLIKKFKEEHYPFFGDGKQHCCKFRFLK